MIFESTANPEPRLQGGDDARFLPVVAPPCLEDWEDRFGPAAPVEGSDHRGATSSAYCDVRADSYGDVSRPCGQEPRGVADTAGEVIEMHDLLDDAGGQVVVEPHDPSTGHCDEVAHLKAAKPRTERIQALAKHPQELTVTSSGNVRSTFPDGTVILR